MPQVSRQVPAAVWNHLDIQQTVAKDPANESWRVHKSWGEQNQPTKLSLQDKVPAVKKKKKNKQRINFSHVCSECILHGASPPDKAWIQDLDTGQLWRMGRIFWAGFDTCRTA